MKTGDIIDYGSLYITICLNIDDPSSIKGHDIETTKNTYLLSKKINSYEQIVIENINIKRSRNVLIGVFDMVQL